MTTQNNGGNTLGKNWGKGTQGQQGNEQVDPNANPDATVAPERTGLGRGYRSNLQQRGTIDSRGERRNNGEDAQYVNVGRGRRFGAVAAEHTDLLKEKLAPLIEGDAERNPDEKLEMKVMLRDEHSIPYDSIVIGQREVTRAGGMATFYYVFVIGQSRQQLTPLSFDNPYATAGSNTKFNLPNVAGDVPNDHINTIATIVDRIDENINSMFGTSMGVVTGVRVIEADAKFDGVDANSNVLKLLADAAEIIETYIENEADISGFDWSNMAAFDTGNSVINDIDYKPEPLHSATGMPIHRQLVLRTSGLEKSYDGSTGNKGGGLRTISEISAFIDSRYGLIEDPRDPQWLPVAVISDFNTQCGGNILHHILIGVANMVQLKDDQQFLPALDWRKKDPFNDISMFGNLAPEPFDIKQAGPLEISSAEEFFAVGRAAYVPSLEIAMDVSNTDRQSWLGPIFAGAAIVDSEEYDSWIKAANVVTGNKFDRYFFNESQRPEDRMIVLDDDNFQLGATFRGTDQELHDAREVGHLAVIAQNPHDPKKVQEYDIATLGYAIEPAVALRTQLDIKTEICGRINVNSYIRRYTFTPNFLIALFEAAKANHMIAPLDGAMRSPNENRQLMADLYRRGVEARGVRREPARQDYAYNVRRYD